MDWFEQAMADIGNAVDEAVDWVGDAVEDVAEAVGNVAEAVVDAVGNAAEAVVDVVGNVAETVVEAVVDVVEDVGEAVVDVVEDVAEWGLNVLDDYVFDPVDYITGGAIDIDYDDGQFSAGLDFGIASVGISVGQNGFSAEAGFDIGIASGEMSYDESDGFAASGSLGVNWGPLPYAEGHIELSPDGEISIGGHLQGTLPLPFGSIGGEIGAELHRNADGSWGASSSTDVELDGPLGMGASYRDDASIEVDADGDTTFDAGFDLSVTGKGGTQTAVSADVGYSNITDADGNIVETIEGAVGVSTGHGDAQASAAFEHTEFADGTVTNTLSGAASSTGFDLPSLTNLPSLTGAEAPGFNAAAPGVEVPAGSSGVNSLGINNPVSTNLTSMIDSSQDLTGAIGQGAGMGGHGAGTVEQQQLDDFSADVESAEGTEAAADEVWDDIGQ